MKESLPDKIELSEIDPELRAAAVRIGLGRQTHVVFHRSSRRNNFHDYAFCGIGGECAVANKPITCKSCIQKLVQSGRMRKDALSSRT